MLECRECLEPLEASHVKQQNARKFHEECYPVHVTKVLRNRRLKAKYGINQEQFDKLLEDQGGCCAICLTNDPGTWWCVDHDHICCPSEVTCGKCIRGILCRFCNIMLGKQGDNPAVFERAIRYLANQGMTARNAVPSAGTAY